MPKIRVDVVSDLHLEHYVSTKEFLENIMVTPHKDSKTQGVLILAGDICQINVLPKYRDFFDLMSSLYLRVIYVPGNHEFYQGVGVNTDIDTAKKFFKSFSNIDFLANGDYVKVGEVAFVGATLWTDVTHCLSARDATEIMKWPDFRFVKVEKSSGVPETQTLESMATLHKKDLDALTVSLNLLDVPTVRSIVPITHFSPVSKVHLKHRLDPKSQFFTNGLERYFMPGGVFSSPRIKHWVYGHTHCSMKFRYHSTQFHCNPAGYPSRRNGFMLENPDFMWHTSFEVHDGSAS